MSSLRGNNYDFLKEISLANISKTKATFQYEFDNFTTLYVIDPFDIIEFCFPAVFNTPVHDNSQMNISAFLGYEFFFFEYTQKHILLSEHKVELYNFWKRIQNAIEEFSSYKDLKSEMVERYKKLSPNEKIFFIESNVGILLALAFGALSKTPLKRFTRLVTEKLQVNFVKTEIEEDTQVLEKVFLDTTPDSSSVNAAFDHFCEKRKWALVQMTEEEQAWYLESTYRDIKVFDRMIRINQKLELLVANKELSRKYNVLMLSSVTKKLDIIEGYYREEIDLYRTIPGGSFVRNNLEVYLHQLLDVGDRVIRKDKILELLEKLEIVSKSYADKSEKIDRYKVLFFDNVETVNPKLLESGRDIDDIFLRYHSMKEQKDKIDKAIKVFKSTREDTELLTQFKNILWENRSDNKNALDVLNDSLDYYTALMESKTDIVSDINYLHKNKRSLKLQVRPGKDSVKSSIQSFPILLFYKKQGIVEIQKLFKHLISPNEKNESILQRLVDTPRSFVYHFTTYEKKVFYLFVRYLFDSKFEDEEVIKDLKEYLFLNQKSRFETSFMEGESLQIHFKENTNLRMDILYFMTWVLRRSNYYQEAISIIDEEEKLQTTVDVRLTHSRALCFKSWYYHATAKKQNFPYENLKKALYDFLKCEIEYLQIQRDGTSDVLIGEIISALSNSIIDTYTKLYLVEPHKFKKEISDSRIRLIELKQTILLAAGAEYDSYLAFGHTEIDLEYCETLIALESDQRNLAIKKIQEANGRLERILQTKAFEMYPAFLASEIRIRSLAKRLLK